MLRTIKKKSRRYGETFLDMKQNYGILPHPYIQNFWCFYKNLLVCLFCEVRAKYIFFNHKTQNIKYCC